MKISYSVKLIALSVVTSALFVGCGGSSDNTTSATEVTTQTGTFVDAPVQGLSYKTATQSGFTDASGHFKYKAGEEVEFKLGNLLLGKGTAGALLTPYSISDNNDTATNIALLLQNFDNNRSDTVLNISALEDYNLSDFNISDTSANLESKLTTLLATPDFQTLRGGTVFNLVNATTAKSEMDAYIDANSVNYDKKFTEAFLSGKTLYQDYVGESGVTTYRFHDKATFKDENPDSETYNQELTGFKAGDGILIVKDGKLYEFTYNSENGSDVYNDGINIFTITSIDETKIVTSMDGYTVNWYFNENDAKSADLAVNGFNQTYLDNTVFYKTNDEYPQYMNKYINGKIYFAGDEENSQGWDSSFGSASATYTLVHGIINANFSDEGNVTLEITEVHDDYILVTAKLGSDSKVQKWYTNKEAAIANTVTN